MTELTDHSAQLKYSHMRWRLQYLFIFVVLVQRKRILALTSAT